MTFSIADTLPSRGQAQQEGMAVANRPAQEVVNQFLSRLRSTARWLSDKFLVAPRSPAELRMAQALLRYLCESRSYCMKPTATAEELIRRQDKIDRAVLRLWRARLGR